MIFIRSHRAAIRRFGFGIHRTMACRSTPHGAIPFMELYLRRTFSFARRTEDYIGIRWRRPTPPNFYSALPTKSFIIRPRYSPRFLCKAWAPVIRVSIPAVPGNFRIILMAFFLYLRTDGWQRFIHPPNR